MKGRTEFEETAEEFCRVHYLHVGIVPALAALLSNTRSQALRKAKRNKRKNQGG